MKRVVLILFIMLFSCGKEEAVPKPEKLLSESEMENIIYDLALLQAIKSTNPQVLTENNIDAKKYIYKKYSTDSLTYNQNHRYYASQLDVYEKIQNRVIERLNKQKTPAATPKNTSDGNNKTKQ